MKLVAIIIIGCLFGAGLGGFCLLKAYDEFHKAIKANSRLRLWHAFSLFMLTLLVAIFTFAGFGMSVRSNLQPLRISLPQNMNNP
jgi:hypothetical protein